MSTQGTITSCSLNKLDVKNHWVLRDLENPQALSSALAALGRYSPGPSSFLNPVEPWFLTSNYYIDTRIHNGLETQYILRLRARYGHVMTFTGYSSIFNRHNTFLSNSPRVFSKTGILFNSFILF